MNRKIMFRGKRVDSGEWIYGMLDCIFKEDGFTTISYVDNEGFYLEDKVDYETVGQFTGLLDKNGKEIYEGDIVKVIYTQFEEDTIHEIKYFADDYSYPAFDLEPCIDFAESNSFQYAYLIYTLEVIGNIHDNQDLLK